MPRYIPGAAYWWPMAPKPPVHRRSSARCTSRRWRLLACPYWAEKGRPAFLGECTAAGGSTTARFRVVSKCALSEISDKAHYPRRKIIREEERKASKIKAFSKNFSDYFQAQFISKNPWERSAALDHRLDQHLKTISGSIPGYACR